MNNISRNMSLSTIAMGGVIALGAIYAARKPLKEFFDLISIAFSNPPRTNEVQMVQLRPQSHNREITETKVQEAAIPVLNQARKMAIPPGGLITMTREEFSQLPNKEKYQTINSSEQIVSIHSYLLEDNEKPPEGWSSRKEKIYELI